MSTRCLTTFRANLEEWIEIFTLPKAWVQASTLLRESQTEPRVPQPENMLNRQLPWKIPKLDDREGWARMDDGVKERAARIESLLPRILRLVYRSTEDSVLAQLPLAQFRILRVLYSGSRTITALGEELGLTASAVTQMANRLQDSGLITRVEDLDDRRIKHLGLTPYAEEMMHARQQRRVEKMATVLNLMPEERQMVVLEALEELFRTGGEVQPTEALWYVAEIEQAVPLSPPYRQ